MCSRDRSTPIWPPRMVLLQTCQGGNSARPLREARGGCRHRRLLGQSCRGLYHRRVAKCRRRLRCLTRDNDKLRGGADPKITRTGFAYLTSIRDFDVYAVEIAAQHFSLPQRTQIAWEREVSGAAAPQC